MGNRRSPFGTPLLLGLYLTAVAPVAAAPTPKLVPVRVSHDAGRVTPGDVIRVDFPIRNEGDAPLTILDVKKDCGCLVPSFDESIAPGGTGNVGVALNTSGFQGPIAKHVYLETDDPSARSVTLTIEAILPRAVEIAPSNEILIPVTPGRPSSVEVTLRSTDEIPLSIGSIVSDAPFVSGELVPGETGRGGEARVRLTVATDAPRDTFETRVLIDTGHIRLARVALRVFGQPAATVMVRPPRLAFGRVRPGDRTPVTRILTLSRTRGSFHILGVEDSLGCLQTQATPGPGGSAFEITLTYRGGWTREETSGVLRVRTDDPVRPLIEIPYTADVW